MRFVVKLLAACGLVAVLAFGLLGGAYYYVNVRPVPFEGNPPEVVIKVDKGSTIRSIANSLKQAGADVDPSILTRAFSFYDQDNRFMSVTTESRILQRSERSSISSPPAM